MSIKQQLIGILRNQNTQRIKFSFKGTSGGDITINGESFTRVANAISEDVIKVVEGGAKDGMAKYAAWTHVLADEDANTFYIGKNDRSSRTFDALIVHESVHAAFDLAKATLPWVDNETAAYIAQGYYLRNSGFPSKRLSNTDFSKLGLMIVEGILNEDKNVGFWFKQMHGALEADPAYHSYIRGTFVGDG